MHGEVGDRQSGTTGSGSSLSGNTNGGLDQFRSLLDKPFPIMLA